MKIVVCVKQVPDTSGKVAVKDNGQLDRASMATITNPDDLAALDDSLAAVAKSGKAADVSIEDTAGKITATNVEGALAELQGNIEAVETASEVTVEKLDMINNKMETLLGKDGSFIDGLYYLNI